MFFGFVYSINLCGCMYSIQSQYYVHINARNISEAFKEELKNNPEKNLRVLVRNLLNGITDDFEKIKVIHDWITLNIKYDIKGFIGLTNKISLVKEVIKYESAVCTGYANLFKEMCEYANIECAIIEGYIKTELFYKNPKKELFLFPNHQWNAVFINNLWYLVDVTCDAGYCQRNYFVKRYSTKYLFSDPNEFILTHYPKESSWQLLTQPISWSDYLKTRE